MAIKNLFPTFDNWTIHDGAGTEITDSIVITEDGYGCSYTITNENSYLRYRISDTSAEALRGHKLKLHLDNFSASDNEPWLYIRLYSDTDNDIYESIDLYYEDGLLSSMPLDYEFTVPMDCVRLDFRFRHEYASTGIEPPAVMTISGLSLVDTYSESISTINFHKVLKENLPASVTPDTQHVYYALNGSIVEQYVSDKAGNLVQVGSGGAAATVQPDWAQNDAAASDYVKNRTHWVEGGSKNIVLFDGELTNFNNMGASYEVGPFNVPIFDDFNYKDIVNCTITYNGTTYTDLIIEEDEGGFTILQQSYSFTFGYYYDGTGFFAHNENIDPLPLKVEVTVSSETYHPLSENFIPDTIARKTDLEAAINVAIGNAIGGSY